MFRQTIIGLLGIIILACAPANTKFESSEIAFLIVDGASNLSEYRTPDEERLQINYSVSLDYPKLAIGIGQWEELKRIGWKSCDNGTSGWNSFQDNSDSDRRVIHRHIRIWSKDNQLLTVSMSYFSNPAHPKSVEPDNDQQHVMILLDSKEGDSIESLKDHLGVSC